MLTGTSEDLWGLPPWTAAPAWELKLGVYQQKGPEQLHHLPNCVSSSWEQFLNIALAQEQSLGDHERFAVEPGGESEHAVSRLRTGSTPCVSGFAADIAAGPADGHLGAGAMGHGPAFGLSESRELGGSDHLKWEVRRELSR